MSFSEGECLIKEINSYSSYDSPYDKLKAGLLAELGTYSYDVGASHAAKGGNFDLAEYILSKMNLIDEMTLFYEIIVTAARFNDQKFYNRFSEIVHSCNHRDMAIEGGNLELFEREYNGDRLTLDDLYLALLSKNDRMIDRVLELIPRNDELYLDALNRAATMGDKKLFDRFLGLIEDKNIVNWEDLLFSVVEGGNLELFDVCSEYYNIFNPKDAQYYISVAIEFGNDVIRDKLLGLLRKGDDNWENVIVPTVRAGNLDFLTKIINEYSRGDSERIELFLPSIKSGNLNMIRYIVNYINDQKPPRLTVSKGSFKYAINEAITMGRLDIIKYLTEFIVLSNDQITLMEKLGMIL